MTSDAAKATNNFHTKETRGQAEVVSLPDLNPGWDGHDLGGTGFHAGWRSRLAVF